MNDWYEEEESSIDMYTAGSTLKVSASNIPEFEKLLAQAKREASALNETLYKLSVFRISFDFSVGAVSSDASSENKE